VTTLWRERALRQLFSPAHLVGILVMVVIFATWAVPYFQTEASMRAAKVWTSSSRAGSLEASSICTTRL
jgi:hypothetical protein